MTENRINDDNIWTVYIHIIPKEITGYSNDKYYVGLTKRSVRKRWQSNGNGYKGQGFYKAIQKYGWNNIIHKILAENLTSIQAQQLEVNLINILHSKDYRYGYNESDGGEGIDGFCMSEERKRQSSEALHALWQDPDFRTKEMERRMGGNNGNAKRIVLLNNLQIYDCISDAAAEWGIDRTTIYNMINKKFFFTRKLDYEGRPLVFVLYDEFLQLSSNEIDNILSNAYKKYKRHRKNVFLKCICLNTRKIYETTYDASIDLGISDKKIRRCCYNQTLSIPKKLKDTDDWIVVIYYDDYIKMSEQDIQKRIYDANRAKEKHGCRIIDSQTMIIYSSQKECCQSLNISKTMLRNVIDNKVNTNHEYYHRFYRYLDYKNMISI